jgi:hypothetical protein
MLARIASVDGRVAVAEGRLRRISKLSPGDYLPHTDLGRFLTEQSRYSEAIESFEYAVSLNSDIPDNFCLLGDAQPVNTASAEQVRDPIYTDAVDFWKNYEAYLEPVRKILTPVMPFKTDRP